MKTLTILTLMALCAVSGYGQTKIGSITISDADAKAYFLDCYNRPDTIREHNEYDYGIKYCDNCTISLSEIKDARAMAAVYNGELHRNAIGKLYKDQEFIGFLVPRKPSEIDYIKYLKTIK